MGPTHFGMPLFISGSTDKRVHSHMYPVHRPSSSTSFLGQPIITCVLEFSADHFEAGHPMSPFNQSDDGEGNYSNEFGDRGDDKNHGIMFNIDPIPGQHQSSQLGDGASTTPSGTSVEAVSSNILKTASKKMRKRKSGPSDGAKQKEKVKMQKFDDECKRYKNELTSSEAYNVLVNDQCDWVLEDLKRRRSIVDDMKKKCNEVTDEVTELCMKLIEDKNESGRVDLRTNAGK